LNFVRPADLGIKKVRADRIVTGVVERLSSLYPNMEFSTKYQKNMEFQVEGDAGLLEQAVNNIIANAVDACQGKGRVEISFGISRHFSDLVRLGRKSDPIVHGHSGKEEEFVRISIRDDGTGMTSEIQEKIFVPFFTTKKTGTGLGLSLAQKIIHAHGGILDLTSGPGKGTDFIIKIPVRQKGG
jgi:two-component system sensor histidine kinase AtoS